MATTEDFVTDNPDLAGNRGRSSQEIRSEIDRTRSDMDETFAALDAKMTPKEIGLELWSLFKGGSSTGASKVWQIACEHPMPTAVVGLGLGWLVVESSRKSDGSQGSAQGSNTYDGKYRGYGSGSYRQGYAGTETDEASGVLSAVKDKWHDVADGAKDAFGSATESLGDAADWTREQASDLGHQVADKASSLGHQVADKASELGLQAKRQVRRARLGFWQTMEENPLLIGAATLAVGVLAGFLLPSTDREDELMGETRDHLLDEVKEAGQQALDKGEARRRGRGRQGQGGGAAPGPDSGRGGRQGEERRQGGHHHRQGRGQAAKPGARGSAGPRPGTGSGPRPAGGEAHGPAARARQALIRRILENR